MATSARTTACDLRAPWPARTEQQVRVFLMADAVGCAKSGQKVPEGYYSMQLMLARCYAQAKWDFAAPAWMPAA